jgi:hypothetical protein
MKIQTNLYNTLLKHDYDDTTHYFGTTDEYGIIEVKDNDRFLKYLLLHWPPAGELKPTEGGITPIEEKPLTLPPKEAKKNGNSKLNSSGIIKPAWTRKPKGNSRGKPRKQIH